MMSKLELSAIVRRHLEGKRLGDITFTVDESGIQTGDDWWRVPVRPSYLPRKLFTLYEFLAEVEQEIFEAEGRNILLLTGEPLSERNETTAEAVAA